jgi:hypothetical protein
MTNGRFRLHRFRKYLAVFLVLAFTEGLLRVTFLARVRLGNPPNCDIRPELLGRLFFAYARPALDGAAGALLEDAHRGFRPAPGLRAKDDDGATMSTNSRGHRGVAEHAVPKPPLVTRIVALGDSFTFGQGVPDDATWPAQLERLLPDTEVVNLGVSAYAHDQMYFALSDEGLALEPDVVILGFYPPDVIRDEMTFYCNEKPRFSLGPDGWAIENVPVPRSHEVRWRYRALPLIYGVPRVLFALLSEPADRGGGARATEIFRRMRAATTAKGARFILVNIPDLWGGVPEANGFFYDYCVAAGIECVDTSARFRDAARGATAAQVHEQFLRPNDMHYARAGYTIVAEALRDYLGAHPAAR